MLVFSHANWMCTGNTFEDAFCVWDQDHVLSAIAIYFILYFYFIVGRMSHMASLRIIHAEKSRTSPTRCTCQTKNGIKSMLKLNYYANSRFSWNVCTIIELIIGFCCKFILLPYEFNWRAEKSRRCVVRSPDLPGNLRFAGCLACTLQDYLYVFINGTLRRKWRLTDWKMYY